METSYSQDDIQKALERSMGSGDKGTADKGAADKGGDQTPDKAPEAKK